MRALSILSFLMMTASLAAAPEYVGTYTWGKKGPYDLKMVLTSKGEGNEYQADFYHVWKKKDHVWKGTVTIVDGKITGKVSDGNKRPRTWRIEGTEKEGVVEAEHYELKKDSEKHSGGLKITKK